MPSNQIPEDVRAELRKHVERSEMWRVFGFNIDTMTDLFVPLIIEWARKDQAKKDRQIAWDIAQVQYNKGRNDMAFGANQVREAIANQFAGDTGGQ